MQHIDYRFSVAPMMGYTDRHYRYMVRLMTKKTYLYTEMISSNSLLYGNEDALLAYHPSEHPIACQIGGSDPEQLYDAAQIISSYQYDEINFNLGCPSKKVQKNQFGACLTLNPVLMESCLKAILNARPEHIPVTVKIRIGIDIFNELFLNNLIERIYNLGIKIIIVHARIALLSKTPKENRKIPPLQHDVVYRLKRKYPYLLFFLNGGIENLQQAKQHLLHVDGCMMGRAAYRDSYLLSEVDQVLFSNIENKRITRTQLINLMIDYIKTQPHVPIHNITRHILGVFHNIKKGKYLRSLLIEKNLDNIEQILIYLQQI